MKDLSGIAATLRVAAAGMTLLFGSAVSDAAAQGADPRYAYNRDFSRVNQIFMNAINQQAPTTPYMAGPAAPASYQGQVQGQPYRRQPYQPQPTPVRAAAKPSAGQPTEQAPDAGPAPKGWGWISEARTGLLWHSAPISTSTPKERGVDLNMELLFKSPDFMKYILSPRPHLGLSVNAGKDTDQAYTGLTWEWNPFSKFIIDFSFGVSVHNGHLHNDAGDEGRYREFGCRALFRESLELGYRFFDRHLVSVMWDHISHGGICDDENEGMDNLGMRYGYMF